MRKIRVAALLSLGIAALVAPPLSAEASTGGATGPASSASPAAAAAQDDGSGEFVVAYEGSAAAVTQAVTSAGGFTGIGCVGETDSPGTSLRGIGRSSTPKSGCPVSRLSM